MKYRMLNDSDLEPKAKSGTLVYSSSKPDYGLARDDTRGFGYECVSVTLDENGDYPLFVVPRHDLERVDA